MSEYPMFDGGESHLVTKTTVMTNLIKDNAATAEPGAAQTDAGPAPGSAKTSTVATAPAAAPKATADTSDPPVGGVMTGKV